MKDNQEHLIGADQEGPEDDRYIFTFRNEGKPYKGHVDLEDGSRELSFEECLESAGKSGEYRGVYVGPWNRMTLDGRCEVLIDGKWTDSSEIEDYSKLLKKTMHYQCRVRGE
jgi:hypothetical protein